MIRQTTGTTKFREDINGLRAWAVVIVILFHFGIPGFAGGFVGVDVFFVISGFLMTKIIINGLENNNLSIVGFYMARARRIMPALLILCTVLLLLGWFVLLPPDYGTLGSHAVSSAAFASNIKYWAESGYFDSASHEKWLLHTWSLSVEWQFYILLPVALWAVWRIKPGRLAQTWAIAVCLLASLVACVFTTAHSPTTAFFMLHTRAWEMLSGGLVFLLSHHFALSKETKQRIQVAGLFLIVASSAALDSTSIWPGWRAIVPVLASAMVLLADSPSPWTGHKIAQWLGDRSYSLYLWHWPIYVALGYAELQHNFFGVAAGLTVTLLLSSASYVLIEVPTRRLLEKVRLPTGVAYLGISSICVLTVGLLVRSERGVEGRFPPAVELAASESNNVNPRRSECHSLRGNTSPSCVFGGQTWKMIAVGDSHVPALVSAIARASPEQESGVVQWSYSGCPFVPGMRTTPAKQATLESDYQCTEFNEWVSNMLRTVSSNVPLIIIGRYAQAAFGLDDSESKQNVPEKYFSKPYPTTTPEFLEEFSRHVTDSACTLAKHRTVYMVRPIPEMGVDVPKTLSRRMAWGFKDEVSIPIAQYRTRNDWVWKAQDAARDKCGIEILDPTKYLCSTDRCFGSKGLRPLYYDDDHLSEFGNRLLIPMFTEAFKDMLSR
jgi:peptidoglycan/LPS O-acetylase OafA/YrhL